MEKDRVIDDFLNNEVSLGNTKIKYVDILFFFCVSLFAYILRIKLYPIVSGDYAGFLEKWFESIDSYGGFKSLRYNISNYTSPYMCLMCMVSGCANRMYALKRISVFFDYSAAIALMMIVYRMTGNQRKALLGYSALLMCPTVFIDSAWWCQCDIIYVSFILWAIWFLLKGKGRLCWIMVGIAFSFKLQTLFIFPFLIIVYLKKKDIKIVQVLYVPIAYLVMHLPAIIAGRPIKEVLMIYADQSGYYPWGTMNYPNAYIFFDETMQNMRYTEAICSAGTYLTIILLGILAYYLYSREFVLDNELMVTIALFSVGITVYFLPHMHERYGLLVDLLGIIYGLLRPKKLWYSCCFILISLVSYMPFLIGVDILEWTTLAIGQLTLLILVGRDMYAQIKLNSLKLDTNS